jgi:hypothetical protein
MHYRPPNPGEKPKPKPTPLAYSRNSDPDDSKYPIINCDGFFKRRSLTDAIIYRKTLVRLNNLRLTNYNNRAQTFLVS